MVVPVMTEQWRPVSGWEGLYEVSDLGRVVSLPRARRSTSVTLRPARDRDGYLQIVLAYGDRKETRKVHHLVGEAFNGTRPDGAQTRHLDGDPSNNTASNLTWGTNAENQADIVRHGRNDNATRTRCRKDHALFGDNLYLNPNSKGRQCRTCQRSARMRYYARSGK
jgi:hypothetical protein